MREILRTGLIGCVVLGSVTVADEARAAPGPPGTVCAVAGVTRETPPVRTVEALR
ncbi:hypothetical protein [Actinoplanes siamensis]|uniref:Uncharacterized protein n=1 Tax=Actinoplanes siamensis TaxID=1223317 RepID=A0A919N4Q0_9ACTN|nr:hypothetical protein [Actinoplanes siamensis]GIF04321.1 hypothetical protein Asi03nite_18590 [Actinoplanes siamensis]